MKEIRYYKHEWLERIVHWTFAISVIVLIVTGLQIAYPSIETGAGFSVFGTLNTALLVHFVASYVLAVDLVIFFYLFFFFKYGEAGLRPSDFRRIGSYLRYYFLFSSKKPLQTEKYNPLQKLAYTGVIGLGVLECVWGFGLYFPSAMRGANDFFGGVLNVRALHHLGSWLFLAFLIIHVYLVFVEDIRNLWAMFTGWGHRHETDADSSPSAD